MPRPALIVAFALLIACDSAPTEPVEAPAEPVAEAPAPTAEGFNPPADAKLLKLGDPQELPADLQGKAHAPQKQDPRVTCRSGRAQLVQRFGEDALIERPVDLGEGETAPGTVVGEGTPFAQEVTWADPAQTKPARIRVLGEGIRDPSGLGLGTTMAELEAAIGPFELAGFGWDYGGTVFLEGTRLAALDGKLIIRLEPTLHDGEDTMQRLSEASGDVVFASSDPKITVLSPTVGEFMMVCPGN